MTRGSNRPGASALLRDCVRRDGGFAWSHGSTRASLLALAELPRPAALPPGARDAGCGGDRPVGLRVCRFVPSERIRTGAARCLRPGVERAGQPARGYSRRRLRHWRLRAPAVVRGERACAARARSGLGRARRGARLARVRVAPPPAPCSRAHGHASTHICVGRLACADVLRVRIAAGARAGMALRGGGVRVGVHPLGALPPGSTEHRSESGLPCLHLVVVPASAQSALACVYAVVGVVVWIRLGSATRPGPDFGASASRAG